MAVAAALMAFAVLTCLHAGTVTYTYDGAGRVVDVQGSDGARVGYTYSKSGNRLTRDGALVTVGFADASQDVAENVVGGQATIALRLSAAAGQDVTVPFTVDGASTATGGGTDYNIGTSPVTIPAGSVDGTIVITLNDDSLQENAETIIVNLGAPTNATAQGNTTHTVTITDDDPEPSVSVAVDLADSVENEAATVTFTVSLSAASGKTVTVVYAVAGSADLTSDYTDASGDYSIESAGTITFDPSQTSRTIRLTVVDDTAAEPAETVTVTLSGPSNATLGGSPQTHTINNWNAAPDAVNDSFAVSEDSSNNALDVLANDTDPNLGDTKTVSAVGATDKGGAVAANADASGLLYTPAADFAGTETFTYTVRDGSNATDTATVTVNVTNSDDSPVAANDVFTVMKGSTDSALDVLANDSDPDVGDTRTVVAVGTPDNAGGVTINGDANGLLYTPAASFVGTETFTYTIRDGSGAEATGTVTVTVQEDATAVTQWQALGPGGGGAFYEAVWHPTDPDTVLAASDVGGIYRSTDNTASWRVTNRMAQGGTWDQQMGLYNVERLAYAASAPDLVFAACWNGVFRSTDGGAAWRLAIAVEMGVENPTRYGVVAIDPADPNLVIVASGGRYFHNPFQKGESNYTSPAGLYHRSTDGGATFQQLTGTGLPDSFAATDVWIDPYSQVGNRTVLLATYEGIFRSTDGGLKYKASNTGLPKNFVRDLDGGATALRSTVYATLQSSGTSESDFVGGVYRSTNGGMTWVNVTAGIPVYDSDLADIFWDFSVAAHPTQPHIAYVLIQNSDSEKCGVYKTQDRGRNWTHLTANWSAEGFSTSWVKVQPGHGGNFLAISPANPNRLVYGNLMELFHTSDGGATWQECYSTKVSADVEDRRYQSRGAEDTYVYDIAFDPNNNTIMWVGFEDVLFWKTLDRGATMAHAKSMVAGWRDSDAAWQILPDPNVANSYYVCMSSPSAGKYVDLGGVFHSSDGGETWTDISTGLPENRPEIALAPARRGRSNPTIYAAVANQGMYKTTDHGQNWTEISNGLGTEKNNVWRLAIDPAAPQTLYVGLNTENNTHDGTAGVYRTTNGGAEWIKQGDLPAREIFDLQVHAGKVYAAGVTELSDLGQGGLYVSEDQGGSWQCLLNQPFIRAFCFDPADANVIYAASSIPGNLSEPTGMAPGVYRSGDSGANWQKIDVDMPHYFINTMAVDPANANHLYVGTQGLGLLRATIGDPAQSHSINGAVSYVGLGTGNIIVEAHLNPAFTAKVAETAITAPGAYTISGLVAGTYHVRAFRDANGNGMLDYNEPVGAHQSERAAAAAVVVSGDKTGINVTLLTPVRLAMKRGWNLISVPARPEGDVDAVFGNAKAGKVWLYDGVQYQETTRLELKIGYWLYIPSDCVVSFLGVETTDGTVTLRVGWTLAGPIGLMGSTIPRPSTHILRDAMYTWDEAYQPRSQLTPGLGYWFHNHTAAEINVDLAPAR